MVEVVRYGRQLAGRLGIESSKPKEFEIVRDGKSWVKYPKGMNLEQFAQDISRLDLVVSDLDDTIVPSPGLEIAVEIGKADPFNPNYIRWAAYSTGQVIFNKDEAVSNSWRYLAENLGDHLIFQRSVNSWTEDKVRQKSHKGVLEVTQSLPQNAQSLLISRNDPRILASFAKVFRYDGFYGYEFEKRVPMGKFLDENPSIHKVLIIGDSKEDAEMVELSREKGRKALSVCVCPNEGKPGFTADVYASVKNQKLLAKMMEGKL
ncbi:MAG: hypothetical protein Q8P80_03115 [Candidatus Levybacteria bacterium]|nr:hypothetical protein [Candidatus Levybacteria bacterium]